MLRRTLGVFQQSVVRQQCFPMRGIEEFLDIPMKTNESPVAGRSWRTMELRRKNFDDLHKLWIVLYKERNMLMTERHDAKSRGTRMKNPARIQKVRLSMNRIKVVIGERTREYQAAQEEVQLANPMPEIEFGQYGGDDDDEEINGSDVNDEEDASVSPKKE